MVTVPADEPVDPNGTIDWIGAYLGVAGLILFNFCWKYVSPCTSIGNWDTDDLLAKPQSQDGARHT